MFSFFKSKEDKLKDYMAKHSINLYRENSDMNTALRDYARNINPHFKNADFYKSQFIVDFVKSSSPYRKDLDNVKLQLERDLQIINTTNSLNGTHWQTVYPNNKSALATQKGNIQDLLEQIEKIEQYTGECNRLGLPISTGFGSYFNV